MRSNDTLPYLLDLQRQVESVEAIPVLRAVQILKVARRTIYRWLETGQLELVPRHGKAWVSVRPLVRYIERRYGSTSDFDIFGETKDSVSAVSAATPVSPLLRKTGS